MTGPTRRQSKSVTVTYGTVSAVLLLVIAAVALIVQPPSPPALAEFAPQPDKTIDEGPDDQSSQFGTGGAGACSAGQVGCEGVGRTTTTLPEDDGGPSQTVIDKARVRRCVGDPPRQIEDPQSPPCAPYWEGPDNGGATSRGVTRDEIRVVYSPGAQQYREVKELQALADFFNRRFELYGRHITVILGRPFETLVSEGAGPEQQRRIAEHAAEQQAFAHLTVVPGSSALYLRRQLAEKRIVSVIPDDEFVSEADLQALHPYAWGYTPSYDRLGRDFGEFACRSLAGHRADYAGAATRNALRSFAVVVGHNAQTATGASLDEGGDHRLLVDGLQACRAPVTVREFAYNTSSDTSTQEALMRALRDEGITTVVPVANDVGAMSKLAEAASKNRYEPEWLLPGGGDPQQFAEITFQGMDPNQTAHLFGLSGWNKILPQPDRASTWAFQEEGLDLYSSINLEADNKYRSLLILAAGIQAAGPRLTPETFAKGLQSLRFPNPGAGAAPYFQATVGFTGDHTMVDDEALVWWSSTAPAYYSASRNVGGWCYVDQGARWRLGQWPSRPDAFFDPTKPCR